MKLKLDRFQFTDKSTIGRLSIDGVFQCFTLEDTYREKEGIHVSNWKIQNETAIPKGNYQVIIDFSNRFQKYLPRLLKVPGFEGVRIHSGNRPEDTEGCVLVGTGYQPDRVINSRNAFALIMDQMEEAYERNEPIELEIT